MNSISKKRSLKKPKKFNSNNSKKASKIFSYPRKWSKEYCKKTSCKKMGFSQRASCRYYKNCYKKSPKKIKSNQLIKNGDKKNKKTKLDKIKNCKQRKISQVMGEFKTKSLKLRNKKVVTNPKQAIAIALSIASKKCEKKK
jgi:hypothetical protein